MKNMPGTEGPMFIDLSSPTVDFINLHANKLGGTINGYVGISIIKLSLLRWDSSARDPPRAGHS